MSAIHTGAVFHVDPHLKSMLALLDWSNSPWLREYGDECSFSGNMESLRLQ